MPSSPNKGYTQPAFNTEVGTWGVDLNNNFSGIVDNNLGGVTSVALSNANVTLTSTQAQNLNIVLTGTLTANVTVITPCIGFFFIINNTTGAFAVSLQANFGSGSVGSALVVPQGIRLFIACDTTNGVQLAAASASGTPVGALQAYAGTSAPTGWLLCYGQAISRTIYAPLFAAISTTYGTGDGSTTFNVPDLRGRAVAGIDNMGGSDAGRIDWTNAAGTTGGEQYHTIAVAELPSHTHTVTDPGHSHTYVYATQFPAAAGGATFAVWYGTQTVGTGTSTTGITIGNTGSGNGANVMQPTMLVNWLIKAF
jgi:microcystin-dependent protein